MADKAAPTTMGRGGFRGGRGPRGNFRGRGNSRGRGRGNFRGQHHHHHDASSAHQQPPTIVTTTPTANITAPTHHKQAQSFKVVSTNTPQSPEKVVPASHITISNASNHTSTTSTNAPTGLKKPECNDNLFFCSSFSSYQGSQITARYKGSQFGSQSSGRSHCC